MKKRLILLLVLILFPAISHAETIKLKSGKVISAKIVEETDQYIRVDLQGTKLTYYLDTIESIEGKETPASVTPEIPAKPIDFEENQPAVIPEDVPEPIEEYNHSREDVKPTEEVKVSDYVQMDYSPGIDPNLVINPTHALNALGLAVTKDGGLDVNLAKADAYGPSFTIFTGGFLLNFALVIIGLFVAFRIYSHFKNG